MSSCEMCGRTAPLFEIFLEEATMKVCGNCSTSGKVLKKPSTPSMKKRFSRPQKVEVSEVLIDNFPSILKKEREKRGMTSKEFAAFLSEKESTLHKMELGSIKPNLDMAKRYEKKLKKKLVVIEEHIAHVAQKSTNKAFTMADFIKKK